METILIFIILYISYLIWGYMQRQQYEFIPGVFYDGVENIFLPGFENKIDALKARCSCIKKCDGFTSDGRLFKSFKIPLIREPAVASASSYGTYIKLKK